MPELYGLPCDDETLFASVHAVGLASFANQYNAPQILKKARKHYVSALQLTNAALCSPAAATKDSTLIAVMLLGLFETITAGDLAPKDSWENHIKGAMLLVCMRGLEQLKTRIGVRLLKQTIDSVEVSCVQRAVRVPAEVLALRDLVSLFVNVDQAPWRFSEWVIRLAAFRAAMKDDLLFDPEGKIERAQQLDADLVRIMTAAGPEWQYETLLVETKSPSFFTDHYHLYPSHRHTEMWNSMRQSRVFLNQIIHDVIVRESRSSFRTQRSSWRAADLRSADHNLTEMSVEICASVPQWTEEFSTPVKPPPLVVSPATFEWHQAFSECLPSASPDTIPSPIASGYFLIWPLFMVGSLPGSSIPLRAWCINRLRFIGSRRRIPQAVLAADALQLGRQEDIWLHTCHTF